MVETQQTFQTRLNALGRKHAAMSNGYRTKIGKDGLIIVKPRRRPRRGISPRGALGLILGFFVFKAFMVTSLTEITYNERVAKLAQGTYLEQGGAYVMQTEPITLFIAGFIEPFVE